ncbi:MAG TPA: DUF3499 domain-containing protein [Candidatus Corynebacterium gallistercoris]|uniref:DUF3499 domain-containing protein n=1 Tax=Candidatus Corynebacterium gallistercoris TaxID=2838530 RepID=A0A9D1UPN4_9CORY|nr:DUF3499 domain-containing protein [Candidatus Corynebacterium gallistercoris]
MRVTVNRPCSRPGCPNPAVATLTYDYAQQVATVGPLHIHKDPHRWDLCADHARRTTVPMGWELNVIDEPADAYYDSFDADDEELMALAQAVAQAQDSTEPEPREENVPAKKIIRKMDTPAPTGHHPSRKNLPTRSPQRHLRAVRDTNN